MGVDYRDRNGFLEFDEGERISRPPKALYSDPSAGVSPIQYPRAMPPSVRSRTKSKLGRADLSDWPVWVGAIVGALIALAFVR
jgi:hypothetical protein